MRKGHDTAACYPRLVTIAGVSIAHAHRNTDKEDAEPCIREPRSTTTVDGTGFILRSDADLKVTPSLISRGT